MYPLNLPKYKFRIRSGEGGSKQYIYDPLRKKELVLTPEEWVRMHIIRFLVEDRNFPPSLISLEAGVLVHKLKQRYDALVYSRQGEPLMLVECKAPEVPINQGTFDQITRYNQSVRASYMLVTNGMKHYCCVENKSTKKYDFLEGIPDYDSLLTGSGSL